MSGSRTGLTRHYSQTNLVHMTHYTVHQAKTHFSKILASVAQGEEVIITSGRSKKHVAKVSRITESTLPRIGFAKDLLPDPLPPEFFDPLPEDELRLWNGEGD